MHGRCLNGNVGGRRPAISAASPISLSVVKKLRFASQQSGIKVIPAEVRGPNDLDTVFPGSARSGVQGGLSCSVDDMSFNERDPGEDTWLHQ